ncbi:calcium-binding protein [Methylobacterium sp. A54F]
MTDVTYRDTLYDGDEILYGIPALGGRAALIFDDAEGNAVLQFGDTDRRAYFTIADEYDGPQTRQVRFELAGSLVEGAVLPRYDTYTFDIEVVGVKGPSASPTAASDDLTGTAQADTVAALAGNDRVLAGSGNDLIFGNQGDDRLFGNQGNDTLRGGQDNDVLYGGQGDDVLYGDRGNDVLSGDLGADRYVFGAQSGTDLILGFSQAQGDRLDLQGQGYTLGTSARGNAVLTLSGGGSVELAGIGAGAVSGAAFA